jgi:hypothetical protein
MSGAEEQEAQQPPAVGAPEAPSAEEVEKAKMEEIRAAKAAEVQRIAEETARVKAEQQAAEAKAKEEEIRALAAEGDALCKFPPEAIQNLSSGLNGLNAEALQHVAEVLKSLQAKQVALIEQLAQEDRKVMTLPHMAEVAQALAHVPSYTKKLQDIRKDMDTVSNRVKAMRKRAAKLYTKKQQEDNTAAQQRQQMAMQSEREGAAE